MEDEPKLASEAMPTVPTFMVMQTGECPCLLLRIPPTTIRQGGRPGKCFLFNVPDGTARFCLEHHLKLASSVEAAFLTRLHPTSSGGLPAVLLRLSAGGHGGVRVVGPPGTLATLHALRHIIRWRHPQVLVDQVSATGVPYVTQDVSILPIPTVLDPKTAESIAKFCRDFQELQQRENQENAKEEVAETSVVPVPMYDAKPAGKRRSQDTAKGCGDSNSSSSDVCDVMSAASSSNSDDSGPRLPKRPRLEADPAVSSSALRARQVGSSGRVAVSDLDPNPSTPVVDKTGWRGAEENPLFMQTSGQDAYVAARYALGPQRGPGGPRTGSLVGFVVGVRRPVASMHLVIDCRDPAGIAALQQIELPSMSLTCIFHFSPPSMVSHAAYAAWVQGLGPAVQHIWLGHPALDPCEPPHPSQAAASAKLHLASQDAFPLPAWGVREPAKLGRTDDGLLWARGLTTVALLGSRKGLVKEIFCARVAAPDAIQREACEAGGEAMRTETDQLRRLVEASVSTQTQAEAATAVDPNQIDLEDDTESEAEGEASPDQSVEAASLWRDAPACVQMACDGEMELRILGTGSAEPSKHRCSSGVYLSLSQGHGLLLDAGEDTLGQLQRCFGEDSRDRIGGLLGVWVSHKHADHCLGLPGILAVHDAWKRERAVPAPALLVVGSTAVRDWLHETTSVMPSPPLYNFVHAMGFNAPNHPLRRALLQPSTGLQHFESVPVEHCYEAYGVVLVHARGWKLVYSGDTRPSPRLVAAGRGATLLIHEATFETQLRSHAIQKKHSTVGEALEVAEDMGAYRVVLTHFSQRYSRVPKLELGVAARQRAVVAFDLMRLSLRDLPWIPRLLTALETVVGAHGALPVSGEGEGGEGGDPEKVITDV